MCNHHVMLVEFKWDSADCSLTKGPTIKFFKHFQPLVTSSKKTTTIRTTVPNTWRTAHKNNIKVKVAWGSQRGTPTVFGCVRIVAISPLKVKDIDYAILIKEGVGDMDLETFLRKYVMLAPPLENLTGCWHNERTEAKDQRVQTYTQ